MKTILAVCVALALISFKGEDTAKIYIARKGLFTGAGGPVKIFIDEKIVCELENNSFSIHALPSGNHKFNAQWTDKTYKNSDFEIQLEIKAGQEYYLQIVKQDKGLRAYANVQEVTASTWKNLKTDLKESDCH